MASVVEPIIVIVSSETLDRGGPSFTEHKGYKLPFD